MVSKTLILACVALAWAGSACGTTTLDKVRARGALTCGVVATPEDWNKTDLHGPLAPLSREFCKAVAVAALGQAAKLELKPYDTELAARQGLGKAEVDLVVGVTPQVAATWTSNIAFGPALFYDGQGVLVRADAHVSSVADLAGFKVCSIEGTDNERILQARTIGAGIAVKALPFQEEGEMDDGYIGRHCDAISAYLSRLAQVQAEYGRAGQDRVLPQLFSLAPIAPAYRRDDAQWGLIVDWTLHSLVQAEASGVTQANVQAQRSSQDPVVQRLLGVDWASSRALGLEAHDWAAQVIAVVGNYGEIYDRTVGAHGALGMPRGLNALWFDGGLMHPLPVQ